MILFSLGLGAIGVFLGLSVLAAFLNIWNGISSLGSFFIRSYGFLAIAIPAYLLYAAFLLAEPEYRPQSLFILGALIIPFFTLSLGVYWIREFESLRSESSFIAEIGKVGIVFFILFVLALEIVFIALVHRLLFVREPVIEQPAAEETSRASTYPEPDNTAPAENRPQSLRDIYAEAAAAVSAGTMNPRYVSVIPYVTAVPEVLPAKPETVAEKIVEEKSIIEESFEENEENEENVEEDIDESAVEQVVEQIIYEETWEAKAKFPEELPEEPEEELPAESDDDVERALAEATAAAKAHAAGEVVRYRSRKPLEYHVVSESVPKRKRPYFVPVDGILKQYPDGEYWIIDDETRNAAITLKETFKEFNIQVEVTGIRKGPVITMFEILPAPGIKLTRIEGLADNIALRLAAQSVRIVAPIPGKHAVGIEIPNMKRSIVSFREIIDGELNGGDLNRKKPDVPVVLGKDITGEAVTVDLAQMPHLLIAGSTGSGKSVCVNSMILSILYQKPPSECRLILIDPKIVELKLYNDIPHLLTPVITESKKAFQALQYCIYEMERRYACLDSMGVRDIRSYNRRIRERDIAAENMPYIVVVIDEFADLMATTGKELESTVARLAAMSRAVGIHLVLATQRPSIDVITGLIKANIPSRIAFMVASKMDSRIIIDMVGAEKLLGKGDMLYAGVVDPFPIRMQGAFISEEEVERVVDYVKSLGAPDYIDDEIFFDDEDESSGPSLLDAGEDPLYEKALEIVAQQGKASASYIQRRLKIGYNRAARLVELMERQGVVGPAQGSKPRELLRGVS